MYTIKHSASDTSAYEYLYFPAWLSGRYDSDTYSISSGLVTNELNRAGSFEFSIPSTNRLYDALKVYKSTITVYDDDRILFHGRPVSIDRDVNNAKTVMCEGTLGWLNDLVISPHTFPNDGINYTDPSAANYFPSTFAGYVKWILTQYNEYIGSNWHSANRHVYVYESGGAIDLQDTAIDPAEPIEVKNYQTALTCIETAYDDLLVEGFYYIWNHMENGEIVSYLVQTPLEPSSSANYPRISFGDNLIDFKENFDGTTICNVLIPLGKTDSEGNPVTIAGVATTETETTYHAYGSISIVSKQLMEECGGRVERVVNYSNIEDGQTLYNKVAEELPYRVIGAKQTIQLGAVDMYRIDEFDVPIRMANFIRFVSIPHGFTSSMATAYLTSKTENDLLDPSQDSYEFTMDTANHRYTN